MADNDGGSGTVVRQVWVEDEEAVRVLRRTVSTPEQIEALMTFVRELVHLSIHSALVSIDGGSESASVGQLKLVDAEGNQFGPALHEKYGDYLLDAGRVT